MYAGAAVNAGLPFHPEVAPTLHALRIVAPDTVQGAALEKDRRPDSRAVMHRKMLNVKYFPLHLTRFLHTLSAQ